jgi:hypothetical protein
VRERDVRDGGIEQLHESRKRDRDGDQPGVHSSLVNLPAGIAAACCAMHLPACHNLILLETNRSRIFAGKQKKETVRSSLYI